MIYLLIKNIKWESEDKTLPAELTLEVCTWDTQSLQQQVDMLLCDNYSDQPISFDILGVETNNN
jgi:hypothetical protein